MKRLSLSMRITLLLGMAAALLLGGAALVMDRMVDAAVGQRLDTALLTQARTLASLAAIGPGGLAMENMHGPQRHLLPEQAMAFWSVGCDDGSMATSRPAPPAYPPGWLHSSRATPAYADIHGQRHALRAVWFKFAANDIDTRGPGRATGAVIPCSVIFMHSRDAMDEVLSVIDDILLLIPLLALLAVLLVSPLLVRRGLKPLATLGEAMRGIGPQAPGQRLPPTDPRELEPLVERFNEVLARMDEGVARERQFAGALAHETRTHLAELRTLVEVEQRYPSHRPLADLLDEIGSIVGELQNTVSGLLLLTRLDAGIEDMHPGRVHLAEVIRKQLESVAGSLQKRRLRVDHPSGAHDTMLVADRALLDIIVGNLLNNAVDYAPEGSTIGIRLQSSALVVDNDAPGIDTAEVERFGQRFWSKHHGIAGHAGLGLALAGAAARAMHMELRFTIDATRRLHATLSWRDAMEADPETAAHDRSGTPGNA